MMPAALPAGHVVAGRFRIVRTLGSGGFGAVYEAAPLDSGAPVALKIMHGHLGSSEPDLRRFEREAALAQQLVHPHIVRAGEFGYTEDGLPFIAFELLHGRSLREELDQRGALSSADTAQIALQLLGALELAHGRAVIHRDIKPANIYLCDPSAPQPLAKVLDFGIAKAMRGDANFTQLTMAGQMLGSPAYMAPEQARGDPIVPAIDLYSLGLVLAEMLSGRPVVQGGSDVDIIMAHVNTEPHPLAGAVRGSPLGAVIERAVDKSLARRFTSAAEMRAAVQQAVSVAPSLPALQSQPLAPRPQVAPPMAMHGVPGGVPPGLSSIPQPASPAPRGGPGLVWVAIPLLVLVGLAAAGGGAWLWSSQRSPASPSGQSPAEPEGPRSATTTTAKRSRPAPTPVDATEWVSESLLRKRFQALGWPVVIDNPTKRAPALVHKFVQVKADGSRASINLFHYRTEQIARSGEDLLRKMKGTACRREGRVVLALAVARKPDQAEILLERLLEGVPPAK